MSSWMKFIVCWSLALPLAYALDIDEKLTSRILRVSSSQHTILINRGLEDGLVIGDHAKFFLPEGVIARGVVVKASPSRSVWSLYRLVNPDLVKSDTVVELKIATPVQLTSDPSKAFDRPGMSDVLTASDPSPKTVTAISGVPMGRGDQVASGERLSASDQEDLAELGVTVPHQANTLHKDLTPGQFPLQDKRWEAWAGASLLTLAMDEKGAMETAVYKGSPSFALGGELYFTQNPWRRWSFTALGNFYRAKKEARLANSITNSDFNLAQFGLGANYHFWQDPHRTYTFIPFAAVQAGIGQAKDFMYLDNTNNGEYSGNSFYAALGGGVKYYVNSGAGARLLVDYYYASQSYKFENDLGTVDQTASGLRWMIIGSFRF
ncbi:MAG: hypothetical protein J6Y94_06010 [Bacteriovoracaceae bacterium]|nr:hypothetical protein [Bacteriovoracaceae bacterium]